MPPPPQLSYRRIELRETLLRRNEELLLPKLLAANFPGLGERHECLFNLGLLESLRRQHVGNPLLATCAHRWVM